VEECEKRFVVFQNVMFNHPLLLPLHLVFSSQESSPLAHSVLGASSQ
jgi:hypothetical protein